MNTTVYTTVYATLDKRDIEELLQAYNDKHVEATDRYRLEETAKPVHHEEIRPLIKKMAKLVELWEEIDAKERASDELTAARMARSSI